jgi:class 3 adenylate cyclase/pimeloyl-ACP methyl ester carboxylesterase
MEHEVRYCTSADGTRIAYTVYGEGPALVRCPGVWASFSSPAEHMRVFDSLDRGRTILHYDFRGIGLSQRAVKKYTVDAFVEDIEAVASSVGFERFALAASAFSAAPAIAYAVRHPEQISRMILSRIFTKGEEMISRANLDAIIALAQSSWETASQLVSDAGVRETDPAIGITYAQLLRQNMEAADFTAMILGLWDTVDVKGILGDVRCPTLILQRRADSQFPFSAAQHAAASIPVCRLVPLPGSGALSVGPDAENNVQMMVSFLDEDPETRALATAEAGESEPVSGLRTVLFTDLVGHTEMMSRLGDKRGRAVLREHEGITREVLKAHGGTEVKTMGDGFMASFGSVTRAVECAIALQKAIDEWNRGVGAHHDAPLRVRCGLNAGEPIEEEGDLFGATVILASRIAAMADGGEILVANAVRELCSGKGFLFADRGEFVAKGFEEPVRVYEVRWRE